MNVAIVGSRDWPFKSEVKAAVASLSPEDTLVSGGAIGVDRDAEYYATKRGLKTLIFPAEWDRFGKSAGYIRNKDIVNASDKVIALQNENSRGTQHTINLAIEKGIPVRLISYSKLAGLQVKAL